VSSPRQLNSFVAVSIWALLSLAVAFYGLSLGSGGRSFAVTLGVFAVLLAVELLLAAGATAERIARAFRGRGAALLAVLPLLAYLIYALGTNSFAWWRVAFVSAYVALPVLLTASCAAAPPGRWQDFAAMFAIWLPVKFRWLLHALWPYPAEQLSYILTVLLALNVGLIAFLFVRRLDAVGYTLGWGRGWTFQVVFNFLAIAVLVIPLGQAIGFLQFEPHWAQARTLPFVGLGILLFTAWPEEFLFRGLLQNLLSRSAGNTTGWLSASILFGLAHIPNGHFPNWRYVILATIAGAFYGRAWSKTGSLFPAALVHALVDITWHFFFRTL
jgi:membrane protease YdiL (CAAX protease family)